MSILEKLNAVKDTVPHYWPIGSFIHHNPLKGFEGSHFKLAVKRAQSIFGGDVYMDASYFMDLYQKDKIDLSVLESNIAYALKEHNLDIDIAFAKTFLMEVSPQWESLRTNLMHYKEEDVDQSFFAYLKERAIFNDKTKWLAQLTKHMTIYEIHDALFGSETKAKIEKDVIEFIARFLDEDQTTMSMPNRELGMFEAFKRFENFTYNESAEQFVEETLKALEVIDEEAYLLTHILKLHGWAGFIKYRSEDPSYLGQRRFPSTLMEYMAVRLYYELKYMKKKKVNSSAKLQHYLSENSDDAIVRLMKFHHRLSGQCLDDLEAGVTTEDIVEKHFKHQVCLDTLQIQHASKLLNQDMGLEDLATVIETLRQEEGYIWLKSLEDTYIKRYVDKFTESKKEEEQKAVASATFCLDVRSEVIRRYIESTGAYKTYGAGGFLGIPIAFVEFDKAHELFLAPAIVKPGNVVFEVPKESSEEYKSKKGVNKTTKKVLNDLKNNPYTPYIMVEAIGWIFGINLFGRTFLPQKTNRLFSKLKPKKPRTTYTIDKLTPEEIEFYIHKLHTKIISKIVLSLLGKEFTKEEVDVVWKHLVFGEDLHHKVPTTIIDKLKNEYQITPEDYDYQKKKLAMVGFSLEEKVTYLHKYLTMIGQVDAFPEFVTIIGHGSISDNNPFESALDCGACGGNISLPNTRTLCMIANIKEVRDALREKGIDIPDNTKFIPGLHITTTDEIKFYDTDVLTHEQLERFNDVKDDFNKASMLSRHERLQTLPGVHTHEDMIVKSMDWSEPRPEWGLAGNMGVFAGPRSSIKHVKLNNKFFMHSYDWRVDNDNADILTRIFDGPLVVGEWINLEHYFSTVDNHVYGAGSKVYHNIVSKVGVYYGNYSDLKIGLPTQSVHLEGKAYHEPVRLLTFMEAPLEKVGKAVENSLAKPFILNEWIRPVIIDKEAKKVYAYEYGDFKVIKELD